MAAARRSASGRRASTAGRVAVDWVRRYPLAPRYRPPATHLALRSADGTRLHAVRLPGPERPFGAGGTGPERPLGAVDAGPERPLGAGDAGPRIALATRPVAPGAAAPCTFVLVHGLANSSRTPGIHGFAHLLAAAAPVVVLDLRGHGASGGQCSFCLHEPVDVEAAVEAARAAAPDLPVVTIGTSLGGSSVLLHAGRFGGVAGAIGVSPAGWSGADDRQGSARAQQVARSPVARAGLRLLTGTRLPGTCGAVPHAEPVVARIAPAFTLVVHDREDHYLGPEHAESIERWAKPPVARWEVVGRGHGTELLDASLAERVIAHVRAHA